MINNSMIDDNEYDSTRYDSAEHQEFCIKWGVGGKLSDYPVWRWAINRLLTEYNLIEELDLLKFRYELTLEKEKTKLKEQSELWDQPDKLLILAKDYISNYIDTQFVAKHFFDKGILDNKIRVIKQKIMEFIANNIQIKDQETQFDLYARYYFDLKKDEENALKQEEPKKQQQEREEKNPRQLEASELKLKPPEMNDKSKHVSKKSKWLMAGLIAGACVLAAGVVVATVLSGPLAPVSATIGFGLLGLVGVHVSAMVATMTGMGVLAFCGSLFGAGISGAGVAIKHRVDARRAVLAKTAQSDKKTSQPANDTTKNTLGKLGCIGSFILKDPDPAQVAPQQKSSIAPDLTSNTQKELTGKNVTTDSVPRYSK